MSNAITTSDGTFEIHTRMMPQRAGTEEMMIWFRNDITGGWDILESGNQTINPNHFSAEAADVNIYNPQPGTRDRDAVATFTTPSITRSLDNYDVEVDWFGDNIAGRLVREDNGTVGVYVDKAYLPLATDSTVSVTIRLKGASADPPAAGSGRSYIYAHQGIGFGMFYGGKTSETEYSIFLVNAPPHENVGYHYFLPVEDLEGWQSTYSVEVLWQYKDHEVGTTTGTLVKNKEGTHSIVGEIPNVEFDNGMIKIRETVNRPAIDGQPPVTYTIEYVGSFNLMEDPPKPVESEPENPSPVEEPGTLIPSGSVGERGDLFTSLDGAGFGALDRIPIGRAPRAFDSISGNVLRGNDDILAGRDEETDVTALAS